MALLEFLDGLGAALIKALVTVRAAPIIASIAFLEMSISVAQYSDGFQQPLRTFYVVLAFIFGLASVGAMLLFFVNYFRRRR
jgi:hypothetical protein